MVISIKWEDIDFKNRSITVNRTMQYRRKEKAFIIGEPKSRSGHRIIPMTHTAYDILMNKKREAEQRKKLSLLYNDFVFLNRNGIPNRNSIYDVAINKISKKAGIEHFSMHTLRHTFATRAIEAGMKPKTLQEILGHSNIGITMNLYVHVTDEEKEKEMEKFELAFGIC